MSQVGRVHFRILHVAVDVWPTTDGDDCQGERYTSGPSDSDKEDLSKWNE